MYGLVKIAADENKKSPLHVANPGVAPIPGRTMIFKEKPSLVNRAYHKITGDPIEYGVNRVGDYGKFENRDAAIDFIQKRINPNTRADSSSQLFNMDTHRRLVHAAPKPLLFGKKEWEQNIKNPEQRLFVDAPDRDGTWSPLVQMGAVHWTKNDKDFHPNLIQSARKQGISE